MDLAEVNKSTLQPIAGRRVRALLLGLPIAIPLITVQFPAWSVFSVLLGQYQAAWIINLLFGAGYAVANLVCLGPLAEFGPQQLESALFAVGTLAQIARFAGLAVIIKGVVGDEPDQPLSGKATTSSDPVLWAVVLGPTGLGQFLQHQWLKAWLISMPFLALVRLISLQGVGPLKRNVPLPSTWGERLMELPFFRYGAESQWFLWLLLGILWLAAIWDAWDTQRKAKQELPVQEGSPSPA